MIHVNFIKPEATLITKDAKVTFADQLGNMGWTDFNHNQKSVSILTQLVGEVGPWIFCSFFPFQHHI